MTCNLLSGTVLLVTKKQEEEVLTAWKLRNYSRRFNKKEEGITSDNTQLNITSKSFVAPTNSTINNDIKGPTNTSGMDNLSAPKLTTNIIPDRSLDSLFIPNKTLPDLTPSQLIIGDDQSDQLSVDSGMLEEDVCYECGVSTKDPNCWPSILLCDQCQVAKLFINIL